MTAPRRERSPPSAHKLQLSEVKKARPRHSSPSPVPENITPKLSRIQTDRHENRTPHIERARAARAWEERGPGDVRLPETHICKSVGYGQRMQHQFRTGTMRVVNMAAAMHQSLRRCSYAWTNNLPAQGMANEGPGVALLDCPYRRLAGVFALTMRLSGLYTSLSETL